MKSFGRFNLKVFFSFTALVSILTLGNLGHAEMKMPGTVIPYLCGTAFNHPDNFMSGQVYGKVCRAHVMGIKGAEFVTAQNLLDKKSTIWKIVKVESNPDINPEIDPIEIQQDFTIFLEDVGYLRENGQVEWKPQGQGKASQVRVITDKTGKTVSLIGYFNLAALTVNNFDLVFSTFSN